MYGTTRFAVSLASTWVRVWRNAVTILQLRLQPRLEESDSFFNEGFLNGVFYDFEVSEAAASVLEKS